MFGFDARTRALLAAVDDAGTVSAAARALGLDPSNAHRHLRLAEARARATLVERARGGAERGRARLTRAGRALLAAGAPRAGRAGARLVGVAGDFDSETGTTPIRVGQRVLHAAGRVAGGPVTVAFRAEDVALERPGAGGGATSVRNAWPVRVRALEELPGGAWRVEVVAGALAFPALVTRGAVRALRLREGSRLVATVKATALRVEPVRA